jgi:hypothetical protein
VWNETVLCWIRDVQWQLQGAMFRLAPHVVAPNRGPRWPASVCRVGRVDARRPLEGQQLLVKGRSARAHGGRPKRREPLTWTLAHPGRSAARSAQVGMEEDVNLHADSPGSREHRSHRRLQPFSSIAVADGNGGKSSKSSFHAVCERGRGGADLGQVAEFGKLQSAPPSCSSTSACPLTLTLVPRAPSAPRCGHDASYDKWRPARFALTPSPARRRAAAGHRGILLASS